MLIELGPKLTKRFDSIPRIALFALRLIAAMFVIVASYFWTSLVYFSDPPPDEGAFDRVTMVWPVHFISALMVGVLWPRYWYLAIAIALFPLMNIGDGIACLSGGRFADSSVCVDKIGLGLVTPILTLAAGYLGSLFVRLILRLCLRKSAD